MKKGFDNQKYLETQSKKLWNESIRFRENLFGIWRKTL